MDARRLATDRLVLFSATAQHVLVELEDAAKLGRLIAASPVDGWPPAASDEKSLRATLSQLQRSISEIGWWRRYVVVRKGPNGRPALVGHAGFSGRPQGGAVLLSSAFVAGHDDDSIRAEALGALVDWAMDQDDV